MRPPPPLPYEARKVVPRSHRSMSLIGTRNAVYSSPLSGNMCAAGGSKIRATRSARRTYRFFLGRGSPTCRCTTAVAHGWLLLVSQQKGLKGYRYRALINNKTTTVVRSIARKLFSSRFSPKQRRHAQKEDGGFVGKISSRRLHRRIARRIQYTPSLLLWVK